ncbi:hypothetical protein L6452_43782 [Arctium lappa]|uniref:Uncharacterized protein n=1 Tax=Arctium lappa TaxID=4217 RepID=A0ACB8XED7_ARCLA|nr:hypothetical protein L6452_43782 [Arctium lappa]
MKSIATKKKAKRQRTEEGEKEQGSERMEAELSRTRDEPSVSATPISSKLPKIIFWDICVEKDKHFLRIKRENNRFEVYTSFHQFIRKCSRSDLEEVYSVGMKLYEDRIQQGAQDDTRLIMYWICLILKGMLQLKLSGGRGSEMEKDLIQLLKGQNQQEQ